MSQTICDECGKTDVRRQPVRNERGRTVQGEVNYVRPFSSEEIGGGDVIGHFCRKCTTDLREGEAVLRAERKSAAANRTAMRNAFTPRPRKPTRMPDGVCMICGARDPRDARRIGIAKLLPGDRRTIAGEVCGDCDRGAAHNGGLDVYVSIRVGDNAGTVYAADFFAHHIMRARDAGDPDPEPPAHPFAHAPTRERAVDRVTQLERRLDALTQSA